MLGNIGKKSFKMRLLCVFLLTLIHFDAYLYEGIHAFQLVETEQPASVSDETIIQDGTYIHTAWGDLSYSKTSSRINWNSLIICILPVLFSFYSIFLHGRKFVSQSCSEALCRLQARSYMAYCTLLI